MAIIYHDAERDIYTIALDRSFIANLSKEVGSVPYDLGVNDPELRQRGYGTNEKHTSVTKTHLLQILKSDASQFRARLEGSLKMLDLLE